LKVGLIGARIDLLGSDLARAGHEPVALPNGAQATDRATDLTLLWTADAASAEAVLAGTGATGLIVVGLCAVGVATARARAARAAAHGVAWLDAPLACGADDAPRTLMVGGDAQAFERARPVLAALAARVAHLGASGAGEAGHACERLIEALALQAVAEALLLAQRCGADPLRVRSALQGGFAASHALGRHGERMVEGRYERADPATPALAAHRDLLAQVVGAAHRLGIALPAAALVLQHCNAQAGLGRGELHAAALREALGR
jgi:2-hydroxy-3-oxopropionate reductase